MKMTRTMEKYEHFFTNKRLPAVYEHFVNAEHCVYSLTDLPRYRHAFMERDTNTPRITPGRRPFLTLTC